MKSLLAVLSLTALVHIGASGSDFERVAEVRSGDTLWSIAHTVFGDASLWPAIYLANRDRIKDPTRVYPGQHLEIPPLLDDDLTAVRRQAEDLLRR